MIRKEFFMAIIMAFTLTLFYPIAAFAVPQIACFVSGTVRDQNGDPLTTGIVKAYVEGFGLCGEKEIVNGEFAHLEVWDPEETIAAGTPVTFKVVIGGTDIDAVSVPAVVTFQSGRFYDGEDYPLVQLTVESVFEEATASYSGAVTDQNGDPISTGTVKAIIDGREYGQAGIQDGQYTGLEIKTGDETQLQGKTVEFQVVIDGEDKDTTSDPAQVTWSTGPSTVNLTVNIAVSPSEPGDVDGSGAIDSNDVQKAIDFALNTTTPTAEELALADMNEDGRVSVLDVVAIIKKMLGSS